MTRKITLTPDDGDAVIVKFDDTLGELKIKQGTSAVTWSTSEIDTKDFFNAVRYVLGLKTK